MSRKKKDNPLRIISFLNRKEVLHMSHDTPWRDDLPNVPEAKAELAPMILEAAQPPAALLKRKRGAPQKVSGPHLALAVLWCVLQGWNVQREVWRLISTQALGRFLPVRICDQTIYKRLEQQGGASLQALWVQITAWLRDWLSPYQEWNLAPFASEVYAIDESVLDAVSRWLKALRALPAGDVKRLAGRISAVFDVRRQTWKRLEVLREAKANCKVYARELLDGLERGALLLFDRGYLAFEWFDDLTTQGFWWIFRMTERLSYQVEHVLVSGENHYEALVWLGIYRTDHARYLVRLVCFRYRGRWYRYLTNVLDPTVLSASQIARLYARRWDIEMAFRLLKDYLGLNLLWSAKWEVLAAQIWACAILAQVLHALQLKVAAEAEVEIFDISLELLLQQVSRRILGGTFDLHELVAFLCTSGRHLGIIRPSTRYQIVAPETPFSGFYWPPPDLVKERPPRYGHRPAGNRKRKDKAALRN
jgi:transposase